MDDEQLYRWFVDGTPAIESESLLLSNNTKDLVDKYFLDMKLPTEMNDETDFTKLSRCRDAFLRYLDFPNSAEGDFSRSHVRNVGEKDTDGSSPRDLQERLLYLEDSVPNLTSWLRECI